MTSHHEQKEPCFPLTQCLQLLVTKTKSEEWNSRAVDCTRSKAAWGGGKKQSRNLHCSQRQQQGKSVPGVLPCPWSQTPNLSPDTRMAQEKTKQAELFLCSRWKWVSLWNWERMEACCHVKHCQQGWWWTYLRGSWGRSADQRRLVLVPGLDTGSFMESWNQEAF